MNILKAIFSLLFFWVKKSEAQKSQELKSDIGKIKDQVQGKQDEVAVKVTEERTKEADKLTEIQQVSEISDEQERLNKLADLDKK